MISIKESYETTVPDTLDLAERAKLAVNALLGFNRRDENSQPNHVANFYRNPPILTNLPGSHNGVGYVFHGGNEMWGKYIEALMEMRLASGCLEEMELDEKSCQGMMSFVEDDNLMWSIIKEVRDDKLVDGLDFCSIDNGARALTSLAGKYMLTGDAVLLDQIRRLTRGFADAAVYKEDYAYYPDSMLGGSISIARGGHTHMREPEGVNMNESRSFHESSSIVHFTYGSLVQGLCQGYRVTRDESALELAGKLVRFMMKERFWKPEAAPVGVVTSDHGQFEGHIHAVCRGFWGILDYALITNDEKLKVFVRDGYEFIRSFGIARIGLLGEICTVGDMTCLAVKLSDAGIGDYWEDVDQYVRNHLTESQILDVDRIKEIPKHAPEMPVCSWEQAENFYERNLGSLCDDATHPTIATPGFVVCCAYNGFNGFYYAWESILRCDDDRTVQINLLLNRASEWLDLDSYEPYEGRAVIRNKKATSVSVRIPRYASNRDVTLSVNGKSTDTFFVGKYLLIHCSPGDEIEIRYPLAESSARYTFGWSGIHTPGWTEISQPFLLAGEPGPYESEVSTYKAGRERESFTCYFKGNTLVDIDPREEGKIGYPIYLRDHFKGSVAPMKKVRRNLAEKLIDWRTGG